VVTNPGFIHDRGDRYRAAVPEEQWDDLYRGLSLRAAGIPLAAGSDAPYASYDPWLAMRTARDRRTAGGADLATSEALDAGAALGLYLGDGLTPGGPARTIAVGAAADLILCTGTLAEVLSDLTAQRLSDTIVAGKPVFGRD
jgi:predicted amidohydrolase YtcJ